MYAKNFPICTVGLYVSLCLMIFLCPFLHCKALRTAMYKRYINSIIIIIIMDLREWMIRDRLNYDKTEFLLLGTKQQLAKVDIASITVGESVVNLGF